MTLVIIYLIGFCVLPIIAIALNKKFPGSMRMDDCFFEAMFMCSFIWPISVFIFIYLLLDYWNNA